MFLCRQKLVCFIQFDPASVRPFFILDNLFNYAFLLLGSFVGFLSHVEGKLDWSEITHLLDKFCETTYLTSKFSKVRYPKFDILTGYEIINHNFFLSFWHEMFLCRSQNSISILCKISIENDIDNWCPQIWFTKLIFQFSLVSKICPIKSCEGYFMKTVNSINHIIKTLWFTLQIRLQALRKTPRFRRSLVYFFPIYPLMRVSTVGHFEKSDHNKNFRYSISYHTYW